MSNHKIIFLCDTNRHVQLQAINDYEGLITIHLTHEGYDDESYDRMIQLDKSTAIKLTKVLRTEIAKISAWDKELKERAEVKNG